VSVCQQCYNYQYNSSAPNNLCFTGAACQYADGSGLVMPPYPATAPWTPIKRVLSALQDFVDVSLRVFEEIDESCTSISDSGAYLLPVAWNTFSVAYANKTNNQSYCGGDVVRAGPLNPGGCLPQWYSPWFNSSVNTTRFLLSLKNASVSLRTLSSISIPTTYTIGATVSVLNTTANADGYLPPQYFLGTTYWEYSSFLPYQWFFVDNCSYAPWNGFFRVNGFIETSVSAGGNNVTIYSYVVPIDSTCETEPTNSTGCNIYPVNDELQYLVRLNVTSPSLWDLSSSMIPPGASLVSSFGSLSIEGYLLMTVTNFDWIQFYVQSLWQSEFAYQSGELCLATQPDVVDYVNQICGDLIVDFGGNYSSWLDCVHTPVNTFWTTYALPVCQECYNYLYNSSGPNNLCFTGAACQYANGSGLIMPPYPATVPWMPITDVLSALQELIDTMSKRRCPLHGSVAG